MKKIFLMLLMCVTVIFAAEIKWEKEYSAAIAKSKAAQKPLMFIVSNHHCRFCVQFETTTLKNPKVVQKLNADFISAIVYIDENPLFPRQLNVPGTPGTWFLKSDGEPMYQPVMGAVESEQFLNALDMVKQEYKKSAASK
ncbi:thioredoxin family protein [Sulfuricurvum sp. RIFCSPLOWO2_12_FULL_43_24]|uniref:thioredoxin family protein n=1 Tax=Sulfuricurvum sp. RIFCSPLOWO2_12_FULL_43_24 TaxID=1802247 RepID=UPI0008B93D08|nr:thioredoxin family protein [Sulfuricurvum sp. RIFCSPLOWO2_12_FULL_43_24]OHD88640.1 MAG: thioredoxin [Sulfuricurvum sp. RIFCSPLOWO2_12_FULL_43_24]OHD88655.1 MAG: thioredoxin [Sulfuricurvum sp. RIFCSPHIGHO2_12_FULL_44_8]OHD91659.1 MAG: thioredoxin [Sulfuricurvum sp. RIFCSPLOWO2_12_43_5]